MDMQWLDQFDRDELKQMLSEMQSAKTPEDIQAIVHKWHETAIAARS